MPTPTPARRAQIAAYLLLVWTLAILLGCDSGSPTEANIGQAYRIHTGNGFTAMLGEGNCADPSIEAVEAAWVTFRADPSVAAVADWPTSDRNPFHLCVPGLGVAGDYLNRQIRYNEKQPRVVAHEAAHWVCYEANLPVDCSRVYHCGGTKLDGTPIVCAANETTSGIPVKT